MNSTSPFRFMRFGPKARALALIGLLAAWANANAQVWTNITDGTASGLWSTAANWSPNTVPNAQDAVADFSTLTITNDCFITNDAAVTVGTLLFANSTSNGKTWTLNGSGGNLITLDKSIGIPTIGVTNVQASVAGLGGALGFEKIGNGALRVYGTASDNNVTGPINVNGGTLLTANGACFANITGDIMVASGASFQVSGGFDGTILYNNIYLNGTGVGGAGALDLDGNGTLAGTITLASDAKITHDWNYGTINGPVVVTNAGQNLELAITVTGQVGLYMNGAINLGTGALTISGSPGAGPVVLNGGISGINTYAGGTIINGGNLILGYGYPTTLDTTSGLTFTGAGGELDLNGNSQTLPFLTGPSGTITDKNTFGGATVLTVNQSTATTFGGKFADGTLATLSLVKQGTGSLTLGGLSTHTGPTTVTAGRLLGTAGGGCANSIIQIADGATNGYVAITPAGQWTCAGLTYDAGTTYINYDFGSETVGPSYPTPMVVNGDVTINGTLNFAITNGIWLSTGVYPMLSYTGTNIFVSPPTNLITLPAGVTASLTNDIANKRIALVVTAIPPVVIPGFTNGFWTNLAGGSWSLATNWLGGAVANGSGATADFSTLNITGDRTVTLDGARPIGNLIFGDTTTSSGGSWILANGTGGPLTLAGVSPTITVNALGGGKEVNISATLAGVGGFTKAGVGQLKLSGGTGNTNSGPINVNQGTLVIADGTSHKNLAGTITVASGAWFYFGQSFSGNNLVNNLRLSGSGISGSGALNLGFNATATGTITLDGDATIAHDWNGGTISGSIIGTNRNLTLKTTVSGQANMAVNGVISLGAGALTVTGSGSQGVTLNNSNNFSGGTYLTAGVLQIGNTDALSGGALTLSGGVLNLNTRSITISSLSGASGSSITDRGAAGTTTLTVNQSAATTYSGVITNGATRTVALTKSGAGTLTLAGTNSYTGATIVTGGRLMGLTGGSCSNSAVQIADGATNGVKLAAANGQWVCGGLTYDVAGNQTLLFDFGSFAPSPSVAPLNVNGSVAFDGTVTVVIPNGLWSGTGSYPLISASGSIAGTTPSVILPPHVGGYLEVTGGNTLNLTVTNATQPIRWAVGNGPWDIDLTANWLDSSDASTTYLETSAGDSVVFDDTAVGASPITVTLNTNVVPANVIANNTSKDYILSGSGSLGGVTMLTKNGAGKFTLSTTNTYSGGTIVNAGTLVVTNGGTLGSSSGALTLYGGTVDLGGSSQTVGVATLGGPLQRGTLTATAYAGLSNTVSATLAGVNAALTKTTAATLTLAGPNTYSGGTTVSGGTLQLGTNNALGSGAVSVASFATLDLNSFTLTNAVTCSGSPSTIANYSSAAPGIMNGNINISGGYAQFNANGGQTLIINGKVSGNVITKGGSGLVVLNGTNSNSGKTELYGGTLRASEGVGLSGGAWLRIGANGSSAVFETGADMTRPFLATDTDTGYSTFTVSIQGGVSGFSAYGAPVRIAIGGLGSPTNLVWGTPGFSQSTLVLNATTANTNLTLLNALDLNGTNRTISVNASVATVASVISNGSGTAGLTKDGAGMLVLTNANTYNGPTTIAAGTLALSGVGSIASSPLISVGGGTTLDVSGLSSTFVLGAGQTLSNGSSGPGIIKGSLNAAGRTVSVAYTNGTPALVVSSGTLTLSGATAFTINNTGPALVPGTYPIITNSGPGTVGGVAPASVNVVGGGLAGAATASLQISGGTLNLVVTDSSVPTPTILPVYRDGLGNLVIRTDTTLGYNYLLLSTTNLVPPVIWVTNSTTAGTGGTITNTVPVSFTPRNQFFRYLVQ